MSEAHHHPGNRPRSLNQAGPPPRWALSGWRTATQRACVTTSDFLPCPWRGVRRCSCTAARSHAGRGIRTAPSLIHRSCFLHAPPPRRCFTTLQPVTGCPRVLVAGRTALLWLGWWRRHSNARSLCYRAGDVRPPRARERDLMQASLLCCSRRRHPAPTRQCVGNCVQACVHCAWSFCPGSGILVPDAVSTPSGEDGHCGQ